MLLFHLIVLARCAIVLERQYLNKGIKCFCIFDLQSSLVKRMNLSHSITSHETIKKEGVLPGLRLVLL